MAKRSVRLRHPGMLRGRKIVYYPEVKIGQADTGEIIKRNHPTVAVQFLLTLRFPARATLLENGRVRVQVGRGKRLAGEDDGTNWFAAALEACRQLQAALDLPLTRHLQQLLGQQRSWGCKVRPSRTLTDSKPTKHHRT